MSDKATAERVERAVYIKEGSLNLRSLNRQYDSPEQQPAQPQDEPQSPLSKKVGPVSGEAAGQGKKVRKHPLLPAPADLPGSARPGYRYVLKNGMTVAVPIDVVDAPVEPESAEAALPITEAEVIPAAVVEEVEAATLLEEEPARIVEEEEDAEAEDVDDTDDLDLIPDAQDYLPPLVEADEPPLVADAPARPRPSPRRTTEEETALGGGLELSEGDAAALWRRLPRHIQLLVGMTPEPREEVAQKYYTRGFKETRHQLIERLLDPTLTLEDTARVLGVCPTTVRRYTNRGVLPCYRTLGQQRRFRLSDVLAFLEKQQAAARAAKNRKAVSEIAEPLLEGKK